MRAKDAIDALLQQDPDVEWCCVEMANALHLTVRTIAREVGVLAREGKAYKHHGRRRRMSFKAALPVELPKWLMPVQLADIGKLTVIRSHIHLLDDE